MLEVLRSPCKMSWQVCYVAAKGYKRVIESLSTKEKAIAYAQQLSKSSGISYGRG